MPELLQPMQFESMI